MTSERQTLADIAQLVIDLYYQGFAPDDSFIELDHALQVVGMAYAERLAAEYRQQKLINKTLSGYSYVEISEDWLTEEVVAVSQKNGKYVGALSQEVFSFDFDSMASGVQSVRPACNNCQNELVRISSLDRWKLKHMPRTPTVFYIVEGKNMEMFSHSCMPTKVSVKYVASLNSLNPESVISVNVAKAITQDALQLLLVAKSQTIVDMTNNSNPNTTPPTETDLTTIGRA